MLCAMCTDKNKSETDRIERVDKKKEVNKTN